jgi:transposase
MAGRDRMRQPAIQDKATNDQQLFEAALGNKAPWHVRGVDFDTAKRHLTISVDFVTGRRFAYPGVASEHPAQDTQFKRLCRLNFFQHERYLEMRVPRVRLPDGSVRLVEAKWVGQLDAFRLLFEALALMLTQQMRCAAAARIVNLSWRRVHAICSRYAELALASANPSNVSAVAIDETSDRRGREYLTLVAILQAQRVVFVTLGRDAKVLDRFAAYLGHYHGTPEQVTSVSIDMSPAFIMGAGEHLHNARVAFDKFHVFVDASKALDTVRWQQQKTAPEPNGMRWMLLKDTNKSGPVRLTDLKALVQHHATKRTARAWMYPEQL